MGEFRQQVTGGRGVVWRIQEHHIVASFQDFASPVRRHAVHTRALSVPGPLQILLNHRTTLTIVVHEVRPLGSSTQRLNAKCAAAGEEIEHCLPRAV